MKDIYIAKGEDKILTRIIIEQYDTRYIVESPYSDESVANSLTELVYSILLATGYQPDTINQLLVELAKEHGYKEATDEEV